MEAKDKFATVVTKVDEDGVVIPRSLWPNYITIKKFKTYERRDKHNVRIEWTHICTRNPQLQLFGPDEGGHEEERTGDGAGRHTGNTISGDQKRWAMVHDVGAIPTDEAV